MRKLNFLIIFSLLLSLSACVNETEEAIIENQNISSNVTKNAKLSVEEAINLGERFRYESTTRSSTNIPEVAYLTNYFDERDTLAYVLNYSDNKGFVIVSIWDSSNPVLAFSQEGCFTFDNIQVNKFLSDNISAYNNTISPNAVGVTEDSFDFSTYLHVVPKLRIILGQFDPWNKHLKPQFAGCPAGCVPIACAYLMSQCKPYLNYHGVSYNTKALIDAIELGQSSSLQPGIGVINGTTDTQVPRVYSYEEAEDKMAQIISLIGEDVNATYSDQVTLADSYNAYVLLRSLGYTIPTGGFVTYDYKSVTNFLINNYLICLTDNSGLSYDDNMGNEGHVWICDGCYYKKDNNSNITSSYLHLDWGWNGKNNAYFRGDVVFTIFEAGDNGFIHQTSYKPWRYMPVKIE